MPICVLANVDWAGKGWTQMEDKLLILLSLLYFYGLGWTRVDAAGMVLGGEGGIRTPDTLTSMPDFESGAFNRALPPLREVTYSFKITYMVGYFYHFYAERSGVRSGSET